MKKILLILTHLFTFLKEEFSLFASEIAPVAVKAVQVIKAIVNNPAADVGAELIAGNVGEEVLTALRSALPNIQKYLSLLGPVDACMQLTDNVQVLSCIAKAIHSLAPELQAQAYNLIAKEIALKLAPAGSITVSAANMLLEIAYQELVSAENQAPAPPVVKADLANETAKEETINIAAGAVETQEAAKG